MKLGVICIKNLKSCYLHLSIKYNIAPARNSLFKFASKAAKQDFFGKNGSFRSKQSHFDIDSSPILRQIFRQKKIQPTYSDGKLQDFFGSWK